MQIITENCPKPTCNFTTSYPCFKFHEERKSGLKKCRNMVSKRCVKCGVNDKLVECFKEEVECQEIVKIALSCEHEVTWLCGSENDPRLDPPGALNCLACVIIMWRNASSNSQTTKSESDILKSFRESIFQSLKSLPGLIIQDSLKVIDLKLTSEDFSEHFNSRKKLLKGYLDMLPMSKEMKGKYTVPPLRAGEDSFLQNYDLVFKDMSDSNVMVDNENDQNRLKTQFRKLIDTKYGFGNRLLLLTEDNLRKQKPSNDGILRICVGLAFRHSCLSDTPQFRIGDKKNEVAQANKQSKIRMNLGYDCVDAAAAKGSSGPSARIYWYAMTSIPLQVVSVKLHSKCSICGDYYAAGEGLCCSKKHIVCWDCLDSYIESVAAPGALAGLIDDNGNVKCPVLGCTDRYKVQHVMDSKGADSKGAADIVEKLTDLTKKAHGIKEAQAARDQLETQWRLEKERIAQIKDLHARKAYEVRQMIIEDVMCLRCPRCKAVFNDFSGCFALSCGRNGCRAGFCAWCLADCGADAHAHVVNCPQGNKSYFGDFKDFNSHHKARRIKIVKEIVGKEEKNVQTILNRLLKKDLDDLL